VWKVRFAAVNCWYDKGSCRQTHKFIQFPVVALHQNSMSEITYTGNESFIRNDVLALVFKVFFMHSFVGLLQNFYAKLNSTVYCF